MPFPHPPNPPTPLPSAIRAFDVTAPHFDERFGAWRSVAAQRRAVRRYLTGTFPPESRLLELGAGSLVQDLNSTAYRELQVGLAQLFREIRRPLIYAGGHDHSLQVIEQEDPKKPQWTLVSGSASKLTDVGPAAGMRFAVDKPRFIRLGFRRDGGVELHVYAAEAAYQHCGDEDDEDVATCMREGSGKYEEVYSSQLREPHSTATEEDSLEVR